MEQSMIQNTIAVSHAPSADDTTAVSGQRGRIVGWALPRWMDSTNAWADDHMCVRDHPVREAALIVSVLLVCVPPIAMALHAPFWIMAPVIIAAIVSLALCLALMVRSQRRWSNRVAAPRWIGAMVERVPEVQRTEAVARWHGRNICAPATIGDVISWARDVRWNPPSGPTPINVAALVRAQNRAFA
jgi:hypothetical protein